MHYFLRLIKETVTDLSSRVAERESACTTRRQAGKKTEAACPGGSNMLSTKSVYMLCLFVA